MRTRGWALGWGRAKTPDPGHPPADLQKTMTAEEMVDVIGYVQALKKT